MVAPLFLLCSLLSHCVPSLSSLPPSAPPAQPGPQQPRLPAEDQGTICPLKCQCAQDGSSLHCSDMTRSELRQLFGSGGTPVTAGLLNLSIVDSELHSLGELPRMERLLWLDLRRNKLERISGTRGALSRREEEALRPWFPALVSLDLGENGLTSVQRHDFLPFPNLEHIRLSANRLFSVDWEAFRLFRLRRLQLADNFLLSISEHMLRFSPALEELDLAHNQLSVAQSSSFFAAQRLRSLNLSRNRLHRFNYDSFAPLFQLESLDLSFNNFSAVPPDIRQFVALRVLNLSGNPLVRVAEGELVQPMLQNLHLSSCPHLRLVERRAFAALPSLQVLSLADNPLLQFVSPLALQNNSLLFQLDLSNNSLAALSPALLSPPSRLLLRHNPLQCGCLSSVVQWAHRVVDNATCTAPDGHTAVALSQLEDTRGKQCPEEPILPFGRDLTGTVGDFFSLYCAPRVDGKRIEWVLANGTELGQTDNKANGTTEKLSAIASLAAAGRFPPSGVQGMLSSVVADSPFLQQPQLDHFQRRRFPSSKSAEAVSAEMPRQRPRLQASGEQLRFEVLMEEDAGEYLCRVEEGAEVRLRLRVHIPFIRVHPVEVGSHYVALVWNDSLKIRATERVQLSLRVRDSASGQARQVQLSLHNPWHSYNVVRLRPLTNYSFCLVYSLRQPGGAVETAPTLFRSCVDVRTEEQLGLWSSLSPTTIGVLLAVCFSLGTLVCFRALYLRFYIWHEAKMRARMNQSMSGQSFLSHSSSLQQQHLQQQNGHRPSSSSAMVQSVCSTNSFDCSPAQLLNQSARNGREAKKKRRRKTTKKGLLAVEERTENGAEPEDIALC